MSQNLKAVLLLVGCFLLAGGARAAMAPDLYAAATPVPDQSDAARNAGFGRDLAAVFVKLSGNPKAPQSAPLAAMVANAGQWVLEFRYQNRPQAQGGGLELWAHFDEKAVGSALARSGLGVWGQERPLVLAWVLTPSGILGDDPANPLVAALHEAAVTRGLPLVLPLMDLADQRQVSAADVRSLNLPVLEAAAKRYDAQALLVGTLGAAGQGAPSDWNLVFGGTTTPYSANAATPQAAADDAVGQAASLLARQLAVVPQYTAGGGKLALVVEQVTNLQAQAAVERLIMNLQGVSTAQLVEVGNDSLRFAVDYAGQPADFARALALTGALVQDNTPPVAASASAASTTSQSVLYFRYTP